jgi:RNA polymerase sigma factor (sigma-70 family)
MTIKRIKDTEPKIKKEKKEKIRNTINKLNPAEIAEIATSSRAFEKLIRENPGFVESAVLSVIQKQNHHPEIKDLLQIGAISLWKAATKYDVEKSGGAKFGTYAYKVIQNGVRQELKTNNRKTMNNISLEDMRSYNEDASSGDIKEHKFVETKQISYLRNFENTILTEMIIKDQFKHLNAFEQQIFNLRFIENKSIAKVAEELNIEQSTLKKWYYVQGGKKKLEDAMDKINGR